MHDNSIRYHAFLSLTVAILENQPESQMGNADKNYKILEAIQIVLFQEIGFCGNKQSYYDVNNSFIDKVCL